MEQNRRIQVIVPQQLEAQIRQLQLMLSYHTSEEKSTDEMIYYIIQYDLAPSRLESQMRSFFEQFDSNRIRSISNMLLKGSLHLDQYK